MDPRAAANLVLDIAEESNIPISNLALNKIVYFLHGIYLAANSKPLVDAKIEAWQYGPVFREIYHQFKVHADRPISNRATILDAETGEYVECRHNVEQIEYDQLRAWVLPYLNMRPAALVVLSHRGGSPWHNAWFHEGSVNPGMEITNDAIRNYFIDQVRH